MKRPSQKALSAIVITAVLMLGYSNCAPQQFDTVSELASNDPIKSDSSTSTATPTPLPPGPTVTPLPTVTPIPPSTPVPEKTFLKDHDFSAVKESRPLDIVWIIDNSGSMTEEASHVRSNFLEFMNTVEASTNTKFALIAQAGPATNSKGAPTTNVNMPKTGSNYLQVNHAVGSTNGLAIAASAVCPVTSIDGTPCAKTLIKRETSTTSALTGFLRAESKKVFVFVTDDESALPSADFLDAFRTTYMGQTPSVFSFVGRSKSESPCIANPGLKYVTLSQQTGGGVFDICKADWKSQFTDIANNVVSSVRRTIQLPADILGAKIISVSIQGHSIAASDYSVYGTELEISLAIASQYNIATVRVVYQPR